MLTCLRRAIRLYVAGFNGEFSAVFPVFEPVSKRNATSFVSHTAKGRRKRTPGDFQLWQASIFGENALCIKIEEVANYSPILIFVATVANYSHKMILRHKRDYKISRRQGPAGTVFEKLRAIKVRSFFLQGLTRLTKITITQRNFNIERPSFDMLKLLEKAIENSVALWRV